MAYSANGYNFTDKSLSRVKYDLLVDPNGDDLKLKGPAPEMIKIAINASTEALFFGAAPDYTPIYFDPTLLSYTYGDQIFTDVAGQRNMVWLSESINEPCLSEMNEFIKNPS